ncbi:VWA domain-containing protein [Vibrio sp. CyArs1]|uniref:VWA domain-containing protein n=1 Tax=Vibrio sp. CyArs1 TaxID=2682577 RepID=UPI001F054596|nr:VWA domain-containing protein [Vibrio sp. CyArs1]
MMLLQPWWLMLFFLPVAVYYLIPPYRRSRSVIKAPFYEQVIKINGGKGSSISKVDRRKRLQKWSLLLTWALLVLCVSEPVLVGKPTTEKKSGRDLMVAIDMSKSMNKKDFEVAPSKLVSRWEGLKSLMDSFSKQREGDRLGLIVFGSGAYLMVPFTDQLNSWREILVSMDVEIAGSATAIGDAIGLSIKAFEHSKVQEKALLLVTDGSDNASVLPPVEAAKVAKSRGIKIYSLAIGNVEQKQGQDRVDFKTLQSIAHLTQGSAFKAEDNDALSNVLSQINNIAPSQFQMSTTPNYLYLYPYILTLVMSFNLLMWVYLIVSAWRKL